MKHNNFPLPRFHTVLLCLLFALGLVGCATNNEQPLPPGPDKSQLPHLKVGETIIVTLSDIPDPPPPYEKPIQDDGTISMPSIGRVQAAGKTPGELEQYIHGLYVPSVYTHLTVTVQASADRVYFVRGEVHQPGRVLYVGPVTVTKAITSAGDFTDFANHKRVYLIRDGKRYRLNCDKILSGDAPDPEVFPGDQIEVGRRIF